jgi:hypothetical protein
MEKKTKIVQFQKEKDTKNTVKFAEVQTQGEAPHHQQPLRPEMVHRRCHATETHGGSAVNLKPSQKQQRRVLKMPAFALSWSA